MLLGQDLRRGDEGALVARRDDLQEGHERDDRLTRTDVPLEEALHRGLALKVGADLRDSVLLRIGELEGQTVAEPIHECGAPGGSDRRGRACATPTHRQPHLQNKRLRKGQCAAGLLVVLVRLRLMQATKAARIGGNVDAIAHRGGNHVGHVRIVEVVENHADGAGDRPRGQGPRRRIDRDGPGGDSLDILPVDAFERRVGELKLAAIGAHFPGKKEGLPGGQDPLDRRKLVLIFREKRGGEELNAVRESDLQADARSGAVSDQVRGRNLGEDRDILPLSQGGQGREAAPVVVPARCHHEQVAHRRNPAARQRLRRLLGQAQGQRDVECTHEAHPATRLGPLCPPSHVSRSIVEDASRVESSWRTVATV